jgi:2-phospho-L-lactate guanylyltransferase
MSIWAVIPIKPLRLAKSRLAPILSPQQRQNLAETMLRHVLKVVQTATQITGTLVISRDNHALTIAREYGAKTIQESGAPELNIALMRATSLVASWRSDAMLILPADLPLISTSDIASIIDLGLQASKSVVISTDREKNGTNALFVRPPGLIEYAYGEGSFRRHAVLARDAGAVVNIYESDRMWQDIDYPEDIENYVRMLRRGHYGDAPPLDGLFHLTDEAS